MGHGNGEVSAKTGPGPGEGPRVGGRGQGWAGWEGGRVGGRACGWTWRVGKGRGVEGLKEILPGGGGAELIKCRPPQRHSDLVISHFR